MGAFEYKPVDFSTVSTVRIISRNSEEYQSYLKSIYDSSSTPQYEKWCDEYPDTAKRFKESAHEALENPHNVISEILSKVYHGDDALCGDCYNGRNDDLRSGKDKLVCWENKPDPSSRKPRKLNADSDLAVDCDMFEPVDDYVRSHGYHPSITQSYFLEKLAGGDGDDEQRKAALKYAYYQIWVFDGPIDGDRYTFHPNREESMLDYLNSEKSKDEVNDLGSGGKAFEEIIQHMVEVNLELSLLDRVFRIETYAGDIQYKEMDLHTRVGDTPIIAELFTSRIPSKKKKQLEDYERLYQHATGFSPESFLVTDEIIHYEEDDDGEYVRVEKRSGRSGCIDKVEFMDRLRDTAGIEETQISLKELEERST